MATNPTLEGVSTLHEGDRSPDFAAGTPAPLGVKALPPEDDLPSLQTGSMVGEGAFTINDVIGRFRNGFAYSAMNNAGRMAILYEFFPHDLVVREGYEEVKPKQGEETDFANLVAAYEASVQALREADYQSLPKVTSTVWANGTFYVATEERSLQGYDKLMDAGGATGGKRPRVIANAVGQALEALIKMHGLGFEHGAITPDLIHISSEGDVRITGPILLTSLAAPMIQDGTGAEVPNPFIAPELLENPYGVSVKSDLYALAASFYNAITRRTPPDAKSRAEAAALKVADNYSPLRKVAVLYRPAFRHALDAAMAYDPAERPRSADNWLTLIRQDATDEVAPPSAPVNPGDAATKPVAPPPIATVAKAVEAPQRTRQTETTSAKKSNMPVILGSGALVAALAVAGVMMFMGGKEDALTVAAGAVLAELPATQVEATGPAEPEGVPEAPTLDTANLDTAPDALTEPAEAEVPNTEPVAATQMASAAASSVPPLVEAPTETARIAAPVGDVLPTQISFAAWDIEMPFMDDKRIIGTTPVAVVTRVVPGTDLSEAGSWIAPGVVVQAINGVPIQQGSGTASAVLSSMKVDPDGKARVVVEYADKASAAPEVGLLTVKAHRLVSLSNGISVQISVADDGWKTVVTAISDPTVSDLQVGDVLFRDKTSGTLLDGDKSLETILQGLVESGTSLTEFSIIRTNKVQTAGMQLATAPVE